jgi:hypothetical protein
MEARVSEPADQRVELQPGLVSILVNNHNYGAYVVDAVRSALDQTYPHIEVIVIDDGSTDDSMARLAVLDDPRLLVIGQSNGGQGAAYNAGWRLASGQYILFLDSDDLLDPAAVEQSVAVFGPETVKVQFALRVIDAQGRQSGRIHPPELDTLGFARMVERYGLYAGPPGSGNLFARRFVDAVMPIQPESSFRSGADSWCILMAPFYGAIASLARPGGSYRVDRPQGVDALRVIGNVNARPSANITKTIECTRLVFQALHAAGRIDRQEPALPSPPMLRAWVLARLQGELDRTMPPWGGVPGLLTILRSVGGWQAYSHRKRVVYVAYLLVCRYLPPMMARQSLRLLHHVGIR